MSQNMRVLKDWVETSKPPGIPYARGGQACLNHVTVALKHVLPALWVVLQTSMLATSPHARWERYQPTARTYPLLLVLVLVSLDATAPATRATSIMRELAAQVSA